MTARLTNKEFITKAQLVHGNKYCYDKIEYIKSCKKINIICQIHGEFQQIPNDHLSGAGCAKCGYCQTSKYTKLKLNDIIIRANNIHNNKFIYNKIVNYKNNRTKEIIICPLHGEWLQALDNHLAGYGCPKCSHTFKFTTETFIEKASKIHNNKYNYSNVFYKNISTCVCITCSKHGDFLQKPSNHLAGKGCKLCSNNISKKEKCWLDSLNISKNYRNYSIILNNKLFKVDGYDPNTKTIYEFYGDYWHGNPKKYKDSELNIRNNFTFGELYKKTINRENSLKESGYNIISIWESDWKKSERL